MNKYLLIKAFPLNNIELINESPIFSLLKHFERIEDEWLKILFIKKSGVLQCFLGFDEKYTSIFCSILRSYNYIVDSEFSFYPDISLISKTVIHRKMVQEAGTKNLSVSSIYDSVNSPTINYLLSNGNDGAGILFVLGRLKNDSSLSPLSTAKKVLYEYSIKESDSIDQLLNTEDHYSAIVFTLGDDQDQLNLAMELSYVVPGLDYTVVSDDFKLDKFELDLFLDDFESNSMIDRRLSRILTTFTKQEFYIISSIYSCIAQNNSLIPNLNSLWKTEVNGYFEKKTKSICVGTSLYDEHEYHIARHKLRQGLLIVGSPGSGKGNQLFQIIEQLKDVPLLIFESAKQEMHHLRQNEKDELGKGVPNLKTWRPIANDFLFNPFEIPEGLSLNEYRASLIQMLRTCFRLDGPLEELFVSTLNRCFYKANYNDSSCSNDISVLKWGLHEFIIEYSRMIKESGYSSKTKDDMRQAGLTRLKAMLDSNPDVYDTDHSISLIDLIKEDSCNLIQLNSLPTIDAKQSLATMLLIALGAYMQLRFEHCSNQNELRLVIVMDESHNLLKSVNDINGVSYSFADDFANLMLTLRSVGVGFIISDQTTANIPKVIADVCDTKMFMGSSRFSGVADYLDFLGADEELLKNLYRLKAGSGVFSFSDAPHGVIFQTTPIIDKYLEKSVEICNDFRGLPASQKAATFCECQLCSYFNNDHMCCINFKQEARRTAQKLILMHGNPFLWDFSKFQFTRQGKKIGFDELNRKQQVRVITKSLIVRFGNIPNACVLIQWVRACNLEYDTSFSSDEIKLIIDAKGGN